MDRRCGAPQPNPTPLTCKAEVNRTGASQTDTKRPTYQHVKANVMRILRSRLKIPNISVCGSHWNACNAKQSSKVSRYRNVKANGTRTRRTRHLKSDHTGMSKPMGRVQGESDKGESDTKSLNIPVRENTKQQDRITGKPKTNKHTCERGVTRIN